MQRIFKRIFIAVGLLLGSINLIAADHAVNAGAASMPTVENVVTAAWPTIEGKGVPIDWAMRKSMFLYGTMPVKDERNDLVGTFEVRYLPGAANIAKDAQYHFKCARDCLADYLKKEDFWRDEVWASCKEGVSSGWDIHCDYGLGQCPQDLQRFRKNFNAIDIAEFGGIGRKCLETLDFSSRCVVRLGASACALVYGVVRSTLAPALAIMAPAIRAALGGGLMGVAVPVVKLVWHGGAWTLTQVYSKTPPQKDSVVVLWIPAEPAIR